MYFPCWENLGLLERAYVDMSLGFYQRMNRYLYPFEKDTVWHKPSCCFFPQGERNSSACEWKCEGNVTAAHVSGHAGGIHGPEYICSAHRLKLHPLRSLFGAAETVPRPALLQWVWNPPRSQSELLSECQKVAMRTGKYSASGSYRITSYYIPWGVSAKYGSLRNLQSVMQQVIVRL